MKKILILSVVTATLMLCIGAVTKRASYKNIVESFMAGILRGEVDQSCDEIFLNSPIRESSEKVNLIKGQIKSGIGLYGKQLDYEFIKEQEYGNSIVRLVYISKAEKLPLTWEFYFYKASSDWKLINLTFNDRFDLLADK